MKNKIRNFCIIAHIDHGKSTLADRLLEYTNTIQVTGGQMLDDMDLEKERGITIKSHAIQMEYTYKGEKYILNLIDTPGHVDFSYEVSRSIAACEGALLIVDASQGVQAQTISNLYMAIEHDLEIIPVINKCDMASAMPEEVEDEIVELLGCKRSEIIRASGKTGMGVEEILAAAIERIPHPEGDEEAPLQALIFDSVFNSFRGIIAYFKIVNGVIRKGDKVKFFNNGKCRLYDLGGEEDGSDSEYVCQCQIITEHQFTLFTISCEGKEEAMAFSTDFVEHLTASKEDKYDKLLEQIEQWHTDDEEQKIVDAILAIPEEEWNAELIGLLARAYNNQEEYLKAIDCLLTVEEEDKDALWFYRLGYAYYYMNQLEKAQKAFERSLELDPDDDDVKEFIDLCKSGESPYDPEMYDPEEMDALEAHIDKYFGKSKNVFHEIASPDIHVDIYIIEPTRKRNYYTLITSGMGAHRMNVPQELAEYKLERAELVIYLPADWNVYDHSEKNYWPLRWLKILARLPIGEDSWLGWGHTVPNGEPFAENTRFSGVMLINPETVKKGADVCRLPNGEEVNFYQVIPLYEEEMNFKVAHNAETLLGRMDKVSPVVDIHRASVCG